MKVFRIALLVFIAALAFCGVAGYFYWQSLRATPQYSLALLIEAARQDDERLVGELVDIDRVVDAFVPQITSRAADIYGRGLPSQTLERLSGVAAPILPAVKEKARRELPRVIRERTESFEFIPFPAMVLGADEYVNVKITGDTAEVKSKLPDRPLEFVMRRNGDRWQIVGVRDGRLAEDIARTVGQQIIAIASGEDVAAAGRRLGVQNLQNILDQAEVLLR